MRLHGVELQGSCPPDSQCTPTWRYFSRQMSARTVLIEQHRHVEPRVALPEREYPCPKDLHRFRRTAMERHPDHCRSMVPRCAMLGKSRPWGRSGARIETIRSQARLVPLGVDRVDGGFGHLFTRAQNSRIGSGTPAMSALGSWRRYRRGGKGRRAAMGGTFQKLTSRLSVSYSLFGFG